jgi:hypothetical protein
MAKQRWTVNKALQALLDGYGHPEVVGRELRIVSVGDCPPEAVEYLLAHRATAVRTIRRDLRGFVFDPPRDPWR